MPVMMIKVIMIKLVIIIWWWWWWWCKTKARFPEQYLRSGYISKMADFATFTLNITWPGSRTGLKFRRSVYSSLSRRLWFVCIVQICRAEDDHSSDRERGWENDGHALYDSHASHRDDGSQAAVCISLYTSPIIEYVVWYY